MDTNGKKLSALVLAELLVPGFMFPITDGS
jgi:hypothetical protein